MLVWQSACWYYAGLAVSIYWEYALVAVSMYIVAYTIGVCVSKHVISRRKIQIFWKTYLNVIKTYPISVSHPCEEYLFTPVHQFITCSKTSCLIKGTGNVIQYIYIQYFTGHNLQQNITCVQFQIYILYISNPWNPLWSLTKSESREVSGDNAVTGRGLKVKCHKICQLSFVRKLLWNLDIRIFFPNLQLD